VVSPHTPLETQVIPNVKISISNYSLILIILQFWIFSLPSHL